MDKPTPRDAATAASDLQPSRTRRRDPSELANDKTFANFYRGFVPTLVAFLRWQGVPLRDAADIAQETMIQAYRYWRSIQHPQAWARRVAARKWARRIAAAVEDPVDQVPEQPSLLTLTNIAEWEERHDVLQLLDQLPARQRQVLAWTLDRYTPTEIAAELKITAEAVRASLAKARRTIAAHLRARGEQR